MNWNWDDIFGASYSIGEYKLVVGNLIIGALIAVGTWFFLFMLKRAIVKPRLIIGKIDEKRRMSIYLIVKYFVWVISFIVILEANHIEITVLLVGSTALLVGLGLGVQSIFKDLVSGLFLLFEGTIKIGDIIEADGVIGRIVEINLRSTEVLTRDDVTIIIPNSRFVTEKVVNWSHNEEQIRFSVGVGVAYGSNVDEVFRCLEEAMDEIPEISKQPKPFVRLNEFGESSLQFEMIFWCRDMFYINNYKSNLRRLVYKKLQENKLVIPFPQRDIHIKTISGDWQSNTSKPESENPA
jgi:small-conductance mechanosensitive channel